MRLACRRYAMAALTAIPLAGCTSNSGPDLPMCSAPVTLTFTASPTPTLSWTPNCLVDHVLVEEPLPPSVGGSNFIWQITARSDGQGAAAPLEYGAVPGSMQELITAEPLEAGHSYRVRIYASDVTVGELGLIYWPPD
jgi:hypothetical protein